MRKINENDMTHAIWHKRKEKNRTNTPFEKVKKRRNWLENENLKTLLLMRW